MILYIFGGNSIPWDPNSKKLGGSEQAVIQLSENWAKQGYKGVYASLLGGYDII